MLALHFSKILATDDDNKGLNCFHPAFHGKHALVNRAGASAAEVLALAGQINAAVEARFGIRLEMEPVMVGF